VAQRELFVEFLFKRTAASNVQQSRNWHARTSHDTVQRTTRTVFEQPVCEQGRTGRPSLIGRRQSLRAQRNERIDAGGPSCRHVTGHRRCENERGSREQERRRVASCHAIEKSRERAREQEGSAQADGHASTRQPQPLAHDHPDHLPPPGAKRHPDADLPRPLCHCVGGDPVEPHDRQAQREPGEG
jgi:hypothetical protein